MLHPVSRTALWLTLAVSAVLALACARYYEVHADGHDWAYGFITQQEAPGLSDRQFNLAIQGVAERHNVAIVGFQLGTPEAAGRRTLYVTAGQRRTDRWIERGGYPAFVPELRLPVEPFEQRRGTRGGLYAVVGPMESRRGVLASLRRVGVDPRAASVASPGHSLGLVVEDPHGVLFTLGLLMVAALAAAGTLLAAPQTAIAQLHGRAFAHQLSRMSLLALRTAGVAGLVVGGIVIALLWAWNGAHGVGLFANFWLPLVALFLMLWAVVTAASLLFVRALPILPRLRGRMDSRAAYVAAFAVVIVALSIATSATLKARAESGVARARIGFSLPRDLAEGVQISMRSSGREPELRRREQRIGEWLATAERAGLLTIAQHDLVMYTFDPKRRLALPAQDQALVVNDRYLRRIGVRDAAGVPIRARSGVLGVFVQPALRDAPELAAVAQAYARDVSTGSRADAPPADAVRARTGVLGARTRLPTLPSLAARDTPEPPAISPAVLVVLPRGAATYGPLDLAALMQQGALVVENAETARRGLRQQHLESYVEGARTIAAVNAKLRSESRLRVALYASTATLAWGFAVLAVVAVAQLAVLRRRQSIVVRLLHGWSSPSVHWLAAATFLVGAVAGTVYAVRGAARASQVTAIVQVPPPPPNWIAPCAVAIAFVVFVAAILRFSRRALVTRTQG